MPTSYSEEERIYHKGFRDGWIAGHDHGIARPYLEPKVDTQRMKAARSKTSPKPKRKASAYNKRYAAAYKRLKKKHPRMSFGAIGKKAHKEARKK